MKVNQKSENRDDYLFKSVKGGKGVKKMSIDEIILYLKNNKVELNLLDQHGYNMFHYGIKSESVDLVSLFLNLDSENYLTEKADPNIKTADTKNDICVTPLILALQSVNDSQVCSRIIKILIKEGADINVKDETQCNIFLRASEKGKIDILDFILNLESPKYDINETCVNGSALHMAILGDQEEVIPFLLKHKIDVSLKDSHGNTALHIALHSRMNNAFKLLQDYIINSTELTDEFKHSVFNAQNDEGNTILHELAYAKSSFLIELIRKFPKEYAVDPDIKNKEGYTYKGVQENVVLLQKQREDGEKQMREEIRKQKLLIAEEKKQELLREKEEEELERLAEEKREQFGITLLKYRGLIFTIVLSFLLFILYLAVNNASKKKEKVI